MRRLTEIKNEIEFHIGSMGSGAKTEAVAHLYGVAHLCTLIALRRGADAELCAASGLLHDLWTYKTGDASNHAHHSAKLAKSILEDIRLFDNYEINTIVEAIRNHTNKGEEHDLYSEVLKDADVLYDYLAEPHKQFSKSKVRRIKNAMREIGINVKVKKK